MKMRKGQGLRKARAIQNTLVHLGMQAHPEQVVAFLAGCGIDVREEMVRHVKLRVLKQAAQAERQRVQVPPVARPTVRHSPKIPPRRSYRS